MARRISFVLATGLIIAILLGACSNSKSADVTIPTLAVLPSGSPQSTVEATPATLATPTLVSEVQNGVDQLFTQTAQVQQQIAPTQTLIAAFNQALTATGESKDATQLSQLQSTVAEMQTESALTATPFVFPTLTPFTFPTQNVMIPPTPQKYIPSFDFSQPTATNFIFPTVTLFPTITPLNFSSSGVSSNPTTCTPPTKWVQYTLQDGDSLAALAQATGTSVETIVQANCLPDADTIYSGEVIYLPNIPISG